MPTSDDDIDIGLLQAGSLQFYHFCTKLKRYISHQIKQINKALDIVEQSKNKICEIYYNKFKQDMLSCLSKYNCTQNFNILSSYEFDANKIKNEFLNPFVVMG